MEGIIKYVAKTMTFLEENVNINDDVGEGTIP